MRLKPRALVEFGVGAGLAALCLFFWMPRRSAASPLEMAPVANWSQLALDAAAIPPGDTTVVVVFNDFQCPFCARFDAAVRNIQANNPAVKVVFRHRPLMGIHPFAKDAAIAAECARNQGRFDAYASGLFSSQRLIGIRPWTEFAVGAGVPDTIAFARCVRSDSTVRRIVERDLAAAATLRSRGTPSFVINGREPSRAPGVAEIEGLVVGARKRDR